VIADLRNQLTIPNENIKLNLVFGLSFIYFVNTKILFLSIVALVHKAFTKLPFSFVFV
jgi:hypothetical protein